MSLEDLGNIGEFVAAGGVIISLVYLAVQIRQNTRAVKVTGYQQLISDVQRQGLIAAQDPAAFGFVLRAYRDYDELSPVEQDRAATYFMGSFVTFQSFHYMYRQGLLDEELWKAHKANLALALALPGARSWWDSRAFSFSRSFVQLVEELAADAEKAPRRRSLHALTEAGGGGAPGEQGR